ncbi:mannitol dehydrogenase family protein [uncultured Cetobacterium sp.]|uniref:mannitol dehydrogenase family protein n=1 Tax=uncultured Cetobacterium sp. TaxID=527638 RepID=UPI002628DBD5|nr:mannitol dehydrogenase family protein [uncultured Cetobacterium sp.]
MLKNIDVIKENTEKTPKWLHFGAGNLFRAYMGKIQNDLLEKGYEDTGIIVAESFDTEIIDKVYTPYNNVTILTTLDKSGEFKNEVIESIVKSIKATDENLSVLEEIVKNSSLQMISFTITEKGYNLAGIESPKHVMNLIAHLLYKRYKNGKFPISLVSMDNCSGNGDKVKEAVLTIAKIWNSAGVVENDFIAYLEDETKVAYPISMIDKITPRPSEVVKNQLENLGYSDMEIVVTGRNSYVAPFVNAEIPEYFIVEDKFPNGRPAFEHTGIFLTDRETVEKTERMKVTTCLNPLHTTLAIFGCILNCKSIYEAASDEDLNRIIKNVGYNEGLKVVENPGIIDPKAFIDEVINERFLNPFIPDQPERIATDTSQKMGIRFGETIKAYRDSDTLDVKDLKYIPLVIAGWFRYLLGVDDCGELRSISSDPMLDMLTKELVGIKFGEKESYSKGQLKNLMKNKEIFGVDLEEVGLSDLVEMYFIEMLSGKNAVRNLLKNS